MHDGVPYLWLACSHCHSCQQHQQLRTSQYVTGDALLRAQDEARSRQCTCCELMLILGFAGLQGLP